MTLFFSLRLYFFFWALLSVCCVSPLAQAAEKEEDVLRASLVRDRYGMPRCLKQKDGHRFLVFMWTKDAFRRQVYLQHIQKRYRARVRHKGARRKTVLEDRYYELCLKGYRSFLAYEPDALDVAPYRAGSQIALYLANRSEVFGFHLPEAVQSELYAVQRGANKRPDFYPFSVESYLREHSQVLSQPFGLEENRRLSWAYGVPFASQLYAKLLGEKEGNRRLLQNIQQATNELATLDESAPLFSQDVISTTSFLIVKGLAHDSQSSRRFDVLDRQLEDFGVPFKVAPTTGLGDMEENTETIKALILEELSSGRDLVIMTLSKGSVEVAWALADLHEQIDHPPVGWGRVKLVLSLSPVYGYSYLVHKLTGFPEWLVVKGQLKDLYADEGNELSDFEGLKQLRKAYMNDLRELWAHQLPQSPSYVNVLGVMAKNGLSQDPNDRYMQDEIVRKRLSGFGANDTYFEYPFTTMDPSWAPKIYEVALNGSHGLIHAEFNGLSMQRDADQRILVGALLRAAFRVAEEGADLE